MPALRRWQQGDQLYMAFRASLGYMVLSKKRRRKKIWSQI